MKAIKKINNNVALCEDANGKELIALGNGIGFPKMPYEIEDMSLIHRTFYGVEDNYISLINQIPEDILDISASIVDYARTKLKDEFSANIVFTLADHIDFALIRAEKKMHVKLPMMYDIQHLYQEEMEVGVKAVRYINKRKGVHLAKEEAASIALHFINAENSCTKSKENSEKIINEITSIIENYFQILINKNGFNHSRFVSHMQYLIQRQKIDQGILSDNKKMFDTVKEEFPDTYECAAQIRQYMKENLKWEASDEELLYLMLHINRLCARESCEE